MKSYVKSTIAVITGVAGGPSPGHDILATNGVADVTVSFDLGPGPNVVTSGPLALSVTTGRAAGVRPVGMSVDCTGCACAT